MIRLNQSKQFTLKIKLALSNCISVETNMIKFQGLEKLKAYILV